MFVLSPGEDCPFCRRRQISTKPPRGCQLISSTSGPFLSYSQRKGLPWLRALSITKRPWPRPGVLPLKAAPRLARLNGLNGGHKARLKGKYNRRAWAPAPSKEHDIERASLAWRMVGAGRPHRGFFPAMAISANGRIRGSERPQVFGLPHYPHRQPPHGADESLRRQRKFSNWKSFNPMINARGAAAPGGFHPQSNRPNSKARKGFPGISRSFGVSTLLHLTALEDA